MPAGLVRSAPRRVSDGSGSRDLVATYAQQIKNKSGAARKSAPRPAAKAAPTAAPKASPQAPLPAPETARSDELQRLKDDLQRINREISRIARETRGGPDAARHSQLPEKQLLLGQKQDLERRIRTLSSASSRGM